MAGKVVDEIVHEKQGCVKEAAHTIIVKELRTSSHEKASPKDLLLLDKCRPLKDP